MIKYLLMDLGGVVFRFDPDRRLQLMAEATPLAEKEIDAAIWSSGLVADADRGVYNATQLATECRQRADLEMDDHQLRKALVSAFEPDDGVVALLDEISPSVTVGAFENSGELFRLGMELNWPEILRRFQLTIWTYEIGMLKPEPAAFRYVQNVLGVSPDEICLVDEVEEHVTVAQGFGWDAIRFTGADALRQALESRGVLGDDLTRLFSTDSGTRGSGARRATRGESR